MAHPRKQRQGVDNSHRTIGTALLGVTANRHGALPVANRALVAGGVMSGARPQAKDRP